MDFNCAAAGKATYSFDAAIGIYSAQVKSLTGMYPYMRPKNLRILLGPQGLSAVPSKFADTSTFGKLRISFPADRAGACYSNPKLMNKMAKQMGLSWFALWFDMSNLNGDVTDFVKILALWLVLIHSN
jgi:hypothetical protein